MGVNRCYSFMKCLLIIFSIILLCVGCGACGLCGWALYDGGSAGGGADGGAGSGAGRGGGPMRVGLAAGLLWGGLLALGAVLALLGAARGSARLLGAGAALLAAAAALEGAAAAWGARHGPELRRALRDELGSMVRRDYGRVGARTELVDALQRGLGCCGADGVQDYLPHAAALDLSVGAPPPEYSVPPSCCLPELGPEECSLARRLAPGAAPSPLLHAAGCAPRALSALWLAARAALSAAAALSALHAAALLLSVALCVRAPQQRYKA